MTRHRAVVSLWAALAAVGLLVVAGYAQAGSGGGPTTSQAAGPAAVAGPVTRLQAGGRAPDFSLPDQHGKRVRLADFQGRKVLVYFYPKADTPGCTAQAGSVRDHRESLAKLGVAVVGISPDASEAQRQFDEKYRLGFPLLSDADHAVAQSYQVWVTRVVGKRTYTGILRSAFLVDEKGRLARVWYDVKPNEMVPAVEAALRPSPGAGHP